MTQAANSALVLTDPQNDFLSENGAAWELVGPSVHNNGTVDNIERLLGSAKASGTNVFVSPHYYYPYDDRWQFGGTLQQKMHKIDMLDRQDPLSLEGFPGSAPTGSTSLPHPP